MKISGKCYLFLWMAVGVLLFSLQNTAVAQGKKLKKEDKTPYWVKRAREWQADRATERAQKLRAQGDKMTDEEKKFENYQQSLLDDETSSQIRSGQMDETTVTTNALREKMQSGKGLTDTELKFYKENSIDTPGMGESWDDVNNKNKRFEKYVNEHTEARKNGKRLDRDAYDKAINKYLDKSLDREEAAKRRGKSADIKRKEAEKEFQLSQKVGKNYYKKKSGDKYSQEYLKNAEKRYNKKMAEAKEEEERGQRIREGKEDLPLSLEEYVKMAAENAEGDVFPRTDIGGWGPVNKYYEQEQKALQGAQEAMVNYRQALARGDTSEAGKWKKEAEQLQKQGQEAREKKEVAKLHAGKPTSKEEKEAFDKYRKEQEESKKNWEKVNDDLKQKINDTHDQIAKAYEQGDTAKAEQLKKELAALQNQQGVAQQNALMDLGDGKSPEQAKLDFLQITGTEIQTLYPNLFTTDGGSPQSSNAMGSQAATPRLDVGLINLMGTIMQQALQLSLQKNSFSVPSTTPAANLPASGSNWDSWWNKPVGTSAAWNNWLTYDNSSTKSPYGKNWFEQGSPSYRSPTTTTPAPSAASPQSLYRPSVPNDTMSAGGVKHIEPEAVQSQPITPPGP